MRRFHVGGLASPDGIGVMLAVAVVNISAESFPGDHAHGRGMALPSVFSLKLLYFSPAINRAIYFD
jgi:hypothetical protein